MSVVSTARFLHVWKVHVPQELLNNVRMLTLITQYSLHAQLPWYIYTYFELQQTFVWCITNAPAVAEIGAAAGKEYFLLLRHARRQIPI